VLFQYPALKPVEDLYFLTLQNLFFAEIIN